MQAPRTLELGFSDFTFDDLHQPSGLARLHARFLEGLRRDDAALSQAFEAYGAAVRGGDESGGVPAPRASELLIAVARHLSRFVGALFRLEDQQASLEHHLTQELELFEFKREFVTRRVFKKGAPGRPTAEELPLLDARMRLLLRQGFGVELPCGQPGVDEEALLARAVLELLKLERALGGAEAAAAQQRVEQLSAELTATAEGQDALGKELVGPPLNRVRALLSLADRWTWARARFTHTFHGWSTIAQPRPVSHDALVELHRPDAAHPEILEGPPQHLRRRDGFGLTDARFGTREVMNEVDYCVLCHEREKDSCSKGFLNKEPSAEGTYKKNPLGFPLAGCPLEEHISEMHALKGGGDPVAALAMAMIANPMIPGTGHRICNDCMKACIFQKQEPVNIPQIETATLTDVLDLPYGFEVYGLLTRFNPLNVRRPVALGPNGKNVLVVGLGPAGYTLSHYLLNEGFTVAAIDGLKLEPFDEALVGPHFEPVRDWRALTPSLDRRVLSGFGGVSEYGITVRWDKAFLTVIYLTLLRRQGFRAFGGVRFGGTVDVEEAWALGFDHIAIAAGAGKPTLVPMKNNLLRGIRMASDFLMGLQLTGAIKKDALANLQVELPALVIGGGLTGIDTATELMAYYPVQVERTLVRHEYLCERLGEARVLEAYRGQALETYRTFLEHGRAVRAERRRAEAAHEAPDFARLVRQWGGVALCYRRGLTESPAYRLNHEEVAKALEEGIRFVERVSPVEAVPDAHGQVSAVRFERMVVDGGKLKGTGEVLELPARTVCVAAGTAPNVTYEREFPGVFAMDSSGYFKAHCVRDGALVPVTPARDLGHDTGFFTSYQRQGRYVTFFGDNHPTYAGNVVKAMASAKDGFPRIARLFPQGPAATPAEEAERLAGRRRLFERLGELWEARVEGVYRLTPSIVEVVVRAPAAARKFEPGQFYRLQNYERLAPVVDGVTLAMEGLALTGAWVDKAQGLMGTIVLEMGSSSRQCAYLKKGEPVVLMGPTGAPTEIPRGETVVLVGGGLGNAVLFSIGQALKAAGCKVLYFAGYRRREDAYRFDDLERASDQLIYSVDAGPQLAPRRPQDLSFTGNVVQALLAYAKGELRGPQVVDLAQVDRVIAIGSDRMMRAVKEARHGVLKPFLKPGHTAIGSINSPMQCMMKEICAQCLQRHVDPTTGRETVVFSCSNQDQPLDAVDFDNLDQRLTANGVLERQADLVMQVLMGLRPPPV